MATALFWFRRDLRLSDNPALVEAVRSADEVVGVFCLDDRLRNPAGAARLTYLYRCMRALDGSMDGNLVVRTGDPRSVASDGVPPDSDLDGIELKRAGEEAAANRLDHFVRAKVEEYHRARDLPGEDATSRLSADLEWGVLHPRQILDRLGTTNAERIFATELCWRDFYADVVFHVPSSARESMNERVGSMPWDSDAAADERFEAWCAGQTGYPSVDAGIRQLATEAWMHNRVRMIVASFLVKDLHLDWQRGARRGTAGIPGFHRRPRRGTAALAAALRRVRMTEKGEWAGTR